jgi:hypothetical protein
VGDAAERADQHEQDGTAHRVSLRVCQSLRPCAPPDRAANPASPGSLAPSRGLWALTISTDVPEHRQNTTWRVRSARGIGRDAADGRPLAATDIPTVRSGRSTRGKGRDSCRLWRFFGSGREFLFRRVPKIQRSE